MNPEKNLPGSIPPYLAMAVSSAYSKRL